MNNRVLALATVAIPFGLGNSTGHDRAGSTHERAQTVARVLPNDNRIPAGRMQTDTLRLRLTVMPADWHVRGDINPAFRVLAFSEEGKAPTIRAPLIRVPRTPVQVHLRSQLGRGDIR